VTAFPGGVLIMEHWSQCFSYMEIGDDPSWVCDVKNITVRVV